MRAAFYGATGAKPAAAASGCLGDCCDATLAHVHTLGAERSTLGLGQVSEAERAQQSLGLEHVNQLARDRGATAARAAGAIATQAAEAAAEDERCEFHAGDFFAPGWIPLRPSDRSIEALLTEVAKMAQNG
jgi:hypothetical protein